MSTEWNSVFKNGSWRRFPATNKVTAADARTTGAGITVTSIVATTTSVEATAVDTVGEAVSAGDTDYVNKS